MGSSNPSVDRSRRWLYDRKDRDDVSADRAHARETFPGTSGGRALPASPVPTQAKKLAEPVNLATSVTVVHTVTLIGTTGQNLDNTAPPARFEGRESDPEGPVGFPTTLEAGFPATQLVADIPGHVLFDVEWLWGILRDDDGYQDPSLGRFRTPCYVTVTRTRAGVAQPRTYGRGRVGASGRKHHLGWTCQKGDIFTFAFPHDDPDEQSLEQLTVTMTIIKTAVAGEDAEDADPPTSLWTVDTSVSPVAIKQLGVDGTETGSTVAPLENVPSGIEMVDGDLWAFVYVDGATYSLVRWTPGDVALDEDNATSANLYQGMAWDGTGFWTWDSADQLVKRIGPDGSVQIVAADSTGIDSSYGGLAWDGVDLWMVGEASSEPRLFKLTATGTLDTAYEIGAGAPNLGSACGLAWDGTHLRYTFVGYGIATINRDGSYVESTGDVFSQVIYLSAGG